MRTKIEKLIFIFVCCQLCLMGCDPTKKIDKHKQPNKELIDTLNPIESTTTDSIRLTMDKKRDRLLNKLIKEKRPNMLDRLKSYPIDGDWRLTKAHRIDIEINEDSFLVLGIDTIAKAIYGHDGCNHIFGDLLLFESGRIEINRIGGSKVACIKPIGVYANNFRHSLEKVRTFKIKELSLFLFNEDEELLIEFERILWEQ